MHAESLHAQVKKLVGHPSKTNFGSLLSLLENNLDKIAHELANNESVQPIVECLATDDLELARSALDVLVVFSRDKQLREVVLDLVDPRVFVVRLKDFRSNISSQSEDMAMACNRLVANMCYNNERGREIVTPSNYAAVTVDLLSELLTKNHPLNYTLLKTSFGALLNFASGENTDIIDQMISHGLVDVIKTYFTAIKATLYPPRPAASNCASSLKTFHFNQGSLNAAKNILCNTDETSAAGLTELRSCYTELVKASNTAPDPAITSISAANAEDIDEYQEKINCLTMLLRLVECLSIDPEVNTDLVCDPSIFFEYMLCLNESHPETKHLSHHEHSMYICLNILDEDENVKDWFFSTFDFNAFFNVLEICCCRRFNLRFLNLVYNHFAEQVYQDLSSVDLLFNQSTGLFQDLQKLVSLLFAKKPETCILAILLINRIATSDEGCSFLADSNLFAITDAYLSGYLAGKTETQHTQDHLELADNQVADGEDVGDKDDDASASFDVHSQVLKGLLSLIQNLSICPVSREKLVLSNTLTHLSELADFSAIDPDARMSIVVILKILAKKEPAAISKFVAANAPDFATKVLGFLIGGLVHKAESVKCESLRAFYFYLPCLLPLSAQTSALLSAHMESILQTTTYVLASKHTVLHPEMKDGLRVLKELNGHFVQETCDKINGLLLE